LAETKTCVLSLSHHNSSPDNF